MHVIVAGCRISTVFAETAPSSGNASVRRRRMLSERTDSSNHGRYFRICCCSFSTSDTRCDIAFHRDCQRQSSHCCTLKAPPISNATAPAVAPTVTSFFDETREVSCCHWLTLGGKNSNRGLSPVKHLAARLSAGETVVPGGSLLRNSFAA